jgi:flagellar biosynthetic protein FliR
VIPGGFAGLEQQLWIWLVAMIRPGAAFLVAPVFGAAFVPVQLRLIVALAIGIAALHAVHFALPADGLASIAGFLLVAGEAMSGLALGFAVQIGFSAALVAGETIGNAMGLGFATMVNPASGEHSPAVGQFMAILATFLFLAADGHLALAAIVIDSYKALPPGSGWLDADSVMRLVLFGGTLFAAGLSIALPVGAALILVQVAMGLLARSAPALNLFAVGLPATLLAGVVLLAMAAPAMSDSIAGSISQGLDFSRVLAAGR